MALDLDMRSENVVFEETAPSAKARGTPKATRRGRGRVGLAGPSNLRPLDNVQ